MNLKELARKAVSTLFLSMLCLVAFAQTATGLVKDKTGEPMIGVNVLVKGTTNGTITDFDGKFSISDVPSNATLVVSYIGYLTKEVKSGKDLIIVLEEDNKTLDEVVVIGYGTVKRRDLTGSVASVTGEKLAANPVANVAQALQGQLPGVSVTSQDGRPGAGMSIRIRGGGSITQSNDPLFIVDGVQVSGIDDIPADNIESIDVLKDAASTAIYGARGANGVILVTTKGGKDGRVSVKYNMYYQMKENPKLLETMDPYDYVYNTWAYMKSLGDSYGDGVARYFGLGSKYGNHLNEYKNMTTHNYINDLMQTASSWNHDVSLSGGTDKTKFYSSVNYMDDEGIRVKSGFQRWNANFKLTQKINKKLTADFDLRYSEIEINGSGFGNATSAYTYRPVDNPLGDASFTAGFGQGDTNMEETSNPLYYLNTVDYIKNMYRIRAKGALTWNVIKGLTAKTELSLNRNWNQEKTWNAGQTEKDNSSAKLKKSDGYGVRWATTLNYEVQGLGDNHNLSFLVGNEVLASKSDYTEIYGVGYPEGFTMDDAFGMINMTTPSLGQDYFKGEIGTPNHTLSWFGRANYSYKGKYLLTATFRADGSSKFGKDNQWAFFPSGAISWKLHEEDFIKKLGVFDQLKLRASYGISGNQGISAYQTLSRYGEHKYYNDGAWQTVIGPGYISGYYGEGNRWKYWSGVPNKELKWETTSQVDLGIDMSFFGGRLNVTFDWYDKYTSDLLRERNIAPSSGYDKMWVNDGKIRNRGIELTLDGVAFQNKDWKVGGTFVFSRNKNKVVSLGNVVETGLQTDARTGMLYENYGNSNSTFVSYTNILAVGHPMYVFYGYKVNGMVQSYADGLSAGLSGDFAQPGEYKYVDLDESGTIDENDRCIIGDPNPDWTSSLGIDVQWKNLDFSIFFNGVFGNDVVNMASFNQPNNSHLRWTVDNPTNEYPRLNMNRQTKFSDWWVEDGSFVRIQNMTLGYTIPLSKKKLARNVRFYVNVDNLYTFSGFKGYDPEVGMTGIYSGGYPRLRKWTIGADITF